MELPQNLENIGANAFYRCDALSKLHAPALWVGTSKVWAAGVGSGCTVVYGEAGVETLVFDANGGSCGTAMRSYPLGVAYGWLPEATATGNWRFAGWWTEAEGGTQVTATAISETEGARRLYAHWTLLTQTVHFSANGGTCDTESATYAIGGTYSPLPTPTRVYHAFAGWWCEGWNVDWDWGEMQVFESTVVTSDSERWFYARWTPVKQVVTFDANGGECDTTNAVYAIGGTYKPLPKATREHYDFDGWFTETGDRLSGSSVVTVDATRTLYAHWTPAKQVVTFVNSYGEAGETWNYAYPIGEPYGWFPEPTREGCVFDGWRTETGEDVDPSSVATTDETRTLYAGWWGYAVSNAEATVTFFGTPRRHVVIPAELGEGPVTGIASNAFRDCTHLVSVEIPDGVTGIGEYAFYNCRGLTSVTIPDSMTGIGYDAFGNCDGLTAVHIHDLAAWCGISFAWGANPLGYAKHLYLDGKELVGDLVIPDGVTSIGYQAFYNCPGLTSVAIPDSVTSIGNYAFYGCSGLTSVTIPNSVTGIGYQTFYGCSGLKTLYAPAAWDSLYYQNYRTDYWHRFWTDYASISYECTVMYGPPTSQETRFDAMGGRCAVVSRMHAVGEAYGELPEATRERYAFGGWWTERVGGKHVTGESLVGTNSLLRLYAHWSLADEGYAAWLAERGEAESSLPVEGDADGDGMTNWEEYVAGTNPRDGTEGLEVRIRWEGGKPKVETSVAVPKGRTVRVEGKKSLVGEEGWTDVTGKEASWAKEGWRFFRVGVGLE